MSTRETINLGTSMRELLSSEVIAFLKMAGELAEKRQQRLYIVGGVVRDILLECVNVDLDLVVEGDAIKMAEEIALQLQAKITTHARFRTATIKWENRSADFVTARAETYAHHGALPKVRPATIKDDLARRDFSINAMAIELNPKHYGELIDPFNGRIDLDRRAVRVLHEKSFQDDATRIWRAVRYEQRLDFEIEPMTMLLINRDLDMLKTVSGERIRHELDLVLKEEMPEKALARADELGVLSYIHPSLKGDAWLEGTFMEARESCEAGIPNPNLYLALLCYRLTAAEAEKVISYLHFPNAAAEVIRDTLAIKNKTAELSHDGQSPSVIYSLLYGYSPAAYAANLIASNSETAVEHIQLYQDVLKHVRPALTGDDLKSMGIPKGPKIKEGLQKLLSARLDGLVENKEEEEQMVKEWGKNG